MRHRQRRQQRNTASRRDHISQGFQAGCAEVGIFISTRFETEAHRLVVQAVAIFQHQQLFTGQIGHRHAIAVRPRVIFIDRQHHRLIEQRHFNKGLTLFYQCQNGAVELAAVQLRQQLMRLRFVQVHFEFRERLVQHRNDVR